MVKEYFSFPICTDKGDTEQELDKLAEKGWRVVCSYAWHGHWLILEREKPKKCKVCGK